MNKLGQIGVMLQRSEIVDLTNDSDIKSTYAINVVDYKLPANLKENVIKLKEEVKDMIKGIEGMIQIDVQAQDEPKNLKLKSPKVSILKNNLANQKPPEGYKSVSHDEINSQYEYLDTFKLTGK